MGWLSSLFGNANGAGRGHVFSHTDDAFSLRQHPDAFNPDSLNAYTYPPQGPSPLLPTHRDPHYPPLSKSWARIHAWLSREYPELGDTLNYGILPQDLAQLELQFGFPLPSVLRESYLCVDGQEAESAAGCSEGLFFGLKLLPLESVLEEWRFWREVDQDPSTGANPQLRQVMHSIPPNWVRKEYSQRGWIPLIADKAGNYVGIDLNPAQAGHPGQVIVFGRDFDTKVVLWKGDGPTGWAKWLASFVEELESGEGFEIGNTDTGEDSEDELGYESYFYDGSGRGQGDGGGDTTSVGGLRYTGEYKGWSVLEVWADRSVRKWHEAGIITDADLASPEDDAPKPKPGDLDIADLTQGPGVEVPIPILNSSEDHIPSPTIGTVNHGHRTRASLSTPTSGPSSSSSFSKRPEHIPAISVTKAPAPLPVALPTPHDIDPLPSPPDSVDGDDIESGRRTSSGLIEISEDMGLVSSTRRTGKSKSPIRRDTSDGASALPLDDPITPRSTLPLLSQAQEQYQPPTHTRVPDLLTDTHSRSNSQSQLVELASPVFEATPPMQADNIASLTPAASSSSNSPAQIQVEQEPESPVPDTTIRLIGGGGTAGISSSTTEEDVEEPSTPTPGQSSEEAAAAVEDANGSADGQKQHKKTKSGGLTNLKRFSGLVPKRKDSDKEKV